DPVSERRTLDVERRLHAARDATPPQSVEQRSKLLKTVQLTIWLKEWLKDHLEWFFEPHQVPEKLKKQYQ
ncbi:unnamed protein product, partial [Durusdinium trenchii]